VTKPVLLPWLDKQAETTPLKGLKKEEQEPKSLLGNGLPTE